MLYGLFFTHCNDYESLSYCSSYWRILCSLLQHTQLWYTRYCFLHSRKSCYPVQMQSVCITESCREVTAFHVTSSGMHHQSLQTIAPFQLPGHDWVVTFILTRWSRALLSPGHRITSPGPCQPLHPMQAKQDLASHSSLMTSGYANLPPAATCGTMNVAVKLETR